MLNIRNFLRKKVIFVIDDREELLRKINLLETGVLAQWDAIKNEGTERTEEYFRICAELEILKAKIG